MTKFWELTKKQVTTLAKVSVSDGYGVEMEVGSNVLELTPGQAESLAEALTAAAQEVRGMARQDGERILESAVLRNSSGEVVF